MAKDKCTCTVCGAQFKRKSGSTNLYCKQECYWQALRNGQYNRGSKYSQDCAHCGTRVDGVMPSKRRNGTRSDKVFCNRDCYDAYRAAEVDRVYGHCKQCKAPLSRRTTRQSSATFCSMDCRNDFKRAKPKNCMSCGCWFTPIKWHSGARRMTTANDMKTCSTECFHQTIRDNEERKEKISAAFTGENHPNWLGGAPMKNRGYRGSGWFKARKQALKRDNYTCLKCGITEEEHRLQFKRGLEVNHIKPFWQFSGDNQKANRLSNLETLCRSCHQLTEWEYRRTHAMQKVLPFG